MAMFNRSGLTWGMPTIFDRFFNEEREQRGPREVQGDLLIQPDVELVRVESKKEERDLARV